jgi:hypothetical protein
MFKDYNTYKTNRKKINFIKLIPDDNLIDQICSIAIIIPHRNRIEHLIKFKSHIDSMKHIQGKNRLDIYVIDQNNADKFNRGFLLNIGYLIAKKHHSYDRYILHDVDSYPDEDLFKLYFKFINYNIHYASPELGYKYQFNDFLGGVFGITRNDFEKINGFPNNFFGWGGEDDAFYNRIAKQNINIYRPSKGSYILPEHDPPTKSELNIKKQQNILDDLKNSYSNGIRQVLNLFINLKQYSFDVFIKSYDNIDRNNTNDSSSIQSFMESDTVVSDTMKSDTMKSDTMKSDTMVSDTMVSDNQYYIYKIDYLSMHTFNSDILLDKNFVRNKINKKLEIYKGQKIFQHPTHPEVISFIEPLITIKEIEHKIFSTYTQLKPFVNSKLDISNREQRIIKLLDGYFKPFETRTKQDLFSTIKFLFETYNELLYFRIRNNKLECAYHLYNLENKVDWLKYVKYLNNQNQTQSIDDGLIEIMNLKNKMYYTLRKPHFIPTNNCLLGFDSYNYFEGIPESYIKEFNEMIEYTIDKFKIVPDSDIIINRKDFALIEKGNRYAYEHLLIGEQANIKDINRFYFFGTQSTKDIHLDIRIPSADEWSDIKKNQHIPKIKWSDKKPIAFFRGSGTGCGQTIENNPRLKLADISSKWSSIPEKANLLDVAISKLVSRIKLYNQLIGLDQTKNYNYMVGSFVSFEDQLKYKYIFNIQGNAQAYRYPNEFKKRSLILNVSEYKMWFEPLLIDNKHMITIKPDYEDLYERLNYLRTNDSVAKKIASNGYKFSKRYINKDMISTYWFHYMLNTNKNTI